MTETVTWFPPLWLKSPMLPEEPPHGIYMRLADRNGVMRITEFQNMTGVKLRHVRIGRDLDQLAAMLRCGVRDIAEFSVTHANRAHSTIAGQRVQRRDDLMMVQRRACPSCVAASPHHRFWWDLHFTTSCPMHGRQLVDRCECGNGLTWRDANIAKCHVCDSGDIRRLPTANASPNIIALDNWILSRFRHEPTAPGIPILEALPLGRAIETIERIGALAVGGYKTRWQEIGDYTDPAPEVRAAGFEVLRSGGLEDLLDRTYLAFAASKSAAPTSLKTMYGWFWQWFGHRGGDRFSPELAKTIYRNAASKIQVTRLALPRTDRSNATITLAETAKMCRRRHGTMRMLLSAEGLIRPTRQKGSPIRINLSDAKRMAHDLTNSLTLADVGQFIGLGQTALIKLVRSGRVPLWVRGGTGTKHRYLFRRKDVQDWLRKLIGTPPIVEAIINPDLISVARAPTATNLPINVLVDALRSGAISVAAGTKPEADFATAYVSLKAVRDYRMIVGSEGRMDPISSYLKPKNPAHA